MLLIECVFLEKYDKAKEYQSRKAFRSRKKLAKTSLTENHQAYKLGTGKRSSNILTQLTIKLVTFRKKRLDTSPE